MLDLTAGPVVVNVLIHRGSIKVDTLPVLINILTRVRSSIIFIDEVMP